MSCVPAPNREPVRARLTFRGKPVIGTHGVFAEFAALALDALTETVAAMGASLTNTLGLRGALPNKDQFQLLITGTAQGTFGFTLEENPMEPNAQAVLFSEETQLESAIGQTKSIIKATLGTDDELAEALSDADPRVLDALRKFLRTMEKAEAVC